MMGWQRGTGVLILVCFWTAAAFAQVRVELLSYSEVARASARESEFFESWNDVALQRGMIRFGMRLGVHRPAATFARQADVSGLTQRYVEFRGKYFRLRLGNFYCLLGRGLTLRSFEHHALRWDSNLDGVYFEIHHSFLDVQLLAGRPRKTRLNVAEIASSSAGGVRLPAQYGGEVRLRVFPHLLLGGTYVYAARAPLHRKGFSRYSLSVQMNHSFGTVYGEIAHAPYPESFQLDDGLALYLSGSLFIGSLSFLVEYKDYRNFAFYNGLPNNPPTVIREHSFTLMNRHQLVQNLNDERGFLAEVKYPVLEDGLLTASYCRTANHAGETIYRDLFLQFGKESFLGGNWLWALARQMEFTRQFDHFVISAMYDLSDRFSIETVYEHFQATDRATRPHRMYYDQMITVGFSKAPKWTLSFVGEHSTDHTLDQSYIPGKARTKHFFWAGGALNLRLSRKISLTLFVGSPQRGKTCIGGVCVLKPELKGMELTLTGRF